MDWTFLRDNLYLDFFADMVGEDGVIRGPAGDGVVAAVTRDDVAASAAEVLAEPGAHVGSTYVLTGPEAITMTQVAEIIARALGREVVLPRRDDRGGLRVTQALGGAGLAERRVGEHLHRHRRRRDGRASPTTCSG